MPLIIKILIITSLSIWILLYVLKQKPREMCLETDTVLCTHSNKTYNNMYTLKTA